MFDSICFFSGGVGPLGVVAATTSIVGVVACIADR
jgi:hypothetical protein